MNDETDAGGVKKFVEKCQVYFDDLDAFGMFYHGRYLALIDRAFFACVSRLGFTPGHEDLHQVVRETQLVFIEPIRQIGDVDVIFWASRVGRSSALFDFVVKSAAGEHVRGSRSVIKFDPATGRSKPWGEKIRAVFDPGSDDPKQ